MNRYELKSNVCILLSILGVLWFCVAALWKTGEVFGAVLRKIDINAYYRTMDRMDNAVERFWRGE
jgi:hypothetical protein